MSGSSDQDLYDSHRNFVNMSIKTIDIDGVTIIRDKKSARQAVKILKMFSNRLLIYKNRSLFKKVFY